ncbi:diguanylate cyclase domain-containing protein [Candidatus Symbiobacter mobilis]|uniref:GGDEF domain protein n=1 Tax=Candidatus Symbiobacter mobilis CR TaxID=946483 RepID=U5N4H1_9BURK|nr:diguanylate cyclase [Candidatus Symbiobacter mobilis]AGX86232.1 GGDEF domain protein [Candidatus Symbiobacter mobilis CR]
MVSRLFTKYALTLSVLVGVSLLASGLVQIWFSYQESKQALILLQKEKAQAAAQRVGQYLIHLEEDMANFTDPPKGLTPLEQRKVEVVLLRRRAAFKTISLVDFNGHEVLSVSRRGQPVLGSGRDYSRASWWGQVQTGRPYRSPVYLREGALYMTVAMSVGPPSAGITIVEIDLEFLLDGITQIKVGKSGHAYAVDAQGYLIAHPNIGLVLQHVNLSQHPQIQAALQGKELSSLETTDLDSVNGLPVLTSYGTIPYLKWLVFVEQARSEAYEPLYAQAKRGALMVLIGIVISVLVGLGLVRKMMVPIHSLSEGAKLIGQGVFDQPIVVSTGDELENLAHEFNRMATKLHESYELLEHKVDVRTRELMESERSLRQAQQIARIGSYVFDVMEGVWNHSEVLNELLGLDNGHVQDSTTWISLIHPKDRKPLRKQLANATLQNGEAFDRVFRIIRHNDRVERWVHGLGQVVRDDEGRIVKVQGTVQDITERKHLEDQICQLAFYDSLTGLPNRRLLADRLSQCLAASERTGYCGALMFIDLDNFKPLNDQHGHAVGDLLLVEVARRLTDCVRKMDTVSRLGGDEFVVMLNELDRAKDSSSSQALGIAKKIRSTLSLPYRLMVAAHETVEHHCTASIGLTVFLHHESSIEDILKHADLAMYEAKEAGRNTVRLYRGEQTLVCLESTG